MATNPTPTQQLQVVIDQYRSLLEQQRVLIAMLTNRVQGLVNALVVGHMKAPAAAERVLESLGLRPVSEAPDAVPGVWDSLGLSSPGDDATRDDADDDLDAVDAVAVAEATANQVG